MATHFGPLTDVVTAAGCVMAAGCSISLAWVRRAKWMPPVETVHDGTAKVAALVGSVLTAILYLQRKQLSVGWFSTIAAVALAVTVIALAVSIYVNTKYSVFKNAGGPQETRRLRGSVLTDEAKKIAEKRGLGHQSLYENGGCRVDLVWTPESIAKVQVMSVLGFITLLFAGSVALASVAIALGIGDAT